MRAIWTGSISFGLINIPVKLYSAAESRDGIDLRMLHKQDEAPIRYAKFCTKENIEVPYEDIVKAYEYDDGRFVVLSDEDFSAAEGEKTATVDIEEFTSEAQIDVRYLERPYYLEPSKGGEKAYALLRESLAQAGKIAVARFVLRQREHLAAIKPVGKMLVLNQMRFPTDLRTPGGLKLPPKDLAGPAELKMAGTLIDQLTKPFIAEDFHDTYTEELEERIEAKVKHQPAPKIKAADTAPVKDLMAALKASLEEAKK
ncbi:MAG TPA: Ku protein [Candidatus Saccharimonadia bacterium]|nr:Ku protein [Candidatus Saccharimonadia bacterium]